MIGMIYIIYDIMSCSYENDDMMSLGFMTCHVTLAIIPCNMSSYFMLRCQGGRFYYTLTIDGCALQTIDSDVDSGDELTGV